MRTRITRKQYEALELNDGIRDNRGRRWRVTCTKTDQDRGRCVWFRRDGSLEWIGVYFDLWIREYKSRRSVSVFGFGARVVRGRMRGKRVAAA